MNIIRDDLLRELDKAYETYEKYKDDEIKEMQCKIEELKAEKVIYKNIIDMRKEELCSIKSEYNINVNYFLAMHDKDGNTSGEIISINRRCKNQKYLTDEGIIRGYFNVKYRNKYHYDGYWIVNNCESYKITENDLIQVCI